MSAGTGAKCVPGLDWFPSSRFPCPGFIGSARLIRTARWILGQRLKSAAAECSATSAGGGQSEMRGGQPPNPGARRSPSGTIPPLPRHMAIPTRAELRAAFAAALEATQSSGDAAAIRAAVAVILPDEADLLDEALWQHSFLQSERRRVRNKILHLADSIQGRDAADQEQADA